MALLLLFPIIFSDIIFPDFPLTDQKFSDFFLTEKNFFHFPDKAQRKERNLIKSIHIPSTHHNFKFPFNEDGMKRGP